VSAAIELGGIIKEFRISGSDPVKVLHGIDTVIRCGELTYLVGESGSGKTTLISIVAGILYPTLGSVRIFGTDLYSLSDTALVRFRLATIGFIFQQYNLLPALTAAENAAIPLIAAKMPRSEAVDRARVMLDRLGIGNQAEKYPRPVLAVDLACGSWAKGSVDGFHGTPTATGHQGAQADGTRNACPEGISEGPRCRSIAGIGFRHVGRKLKELVVIPVLETDTIRCEIGGIQPISIVSDSYPHSAAHGDRQFDELRLGHSAVGALSSGNSMVPMMRSVSARILMILW
jgi:hypothetical protein